VAQFFARRTEKRKRKRKRKTPEYRLKVENGADFSLNDEPKSKQRLFAGLIIGNQSEITFLVARVDEKIKKEDAMASIDDLHCALLTMVLD
jgi:hypothetical protein